MSLTLSISISHVYPSCTVTPLPLNVVCTDCWQSAWEGECGQQVLARACLRALRRFLPKSRNAARHYTIHALNPFTLYHRVSLYTVFAIGVLLAIQSAKAKGNRQVPSHQFPPLSADSSLVCGARPEPSG